MRITTRGRYALRASLAMARMSRNGEPVSINSLSEEEGISSVFLEQIFFKLRKAGLVSSVRGPGGGFCFALPLDKISVKTLLDAAGEDLDAGYCDKHQDDCEHLSGCLAHQVWDDAVRLVNDFFRGLTVASILERKAVFPYHREDADTQDQTE